MAFSAGSSVDDIVRTTPAAEPVPWLPPRSETGTFCPFLYKDDHFAKTCSEQT